MKNSLKTLAIMAIAIFAVQCLQAVPITGVIGFSGTAQLNGSTVGTSTEVLSWGANTVGIASGSFTGLTGLPVGLAAPWFFNSGLLNNFWSVGGFHFNQSSSSVYSNIGGFLSVFLTGTVTASAFSPTPFTGRFTIQDPATTGNGIFKYTESMSFGAVPDGGVTALLLLVSFAGMVVLKREIFA